ncbi:hypothetical protein LTR50_003087 [Elasticomyces elasticus]|nr:hypothetical protein LTR50_003087 [Elasticomyces elasticus]
MQSVRQHRRFRTTLEVQLVRDREKVEPRARHDDLAHATPVPRQDPLDSDEQTELEKGESSSGSSVRGRLDASDGLRRGELNESITRSSARQEEAETLEANLNPEDVSDGDGDDDDNDLRLNQSQRSNAPSLKSTRSAGTALGNALIGITIRKRSTREGQSGNVFVVSWEGVDDPQNPHNWSNTVRIAATLLIASIGFIVGFASSIDSSALLQASEEFGVSEVVESLASGLFLIGFGVGALFAGPISETVGRNPVYIVTLILYMVFVMATGLSPNVGAQLGFRFLAGLFGSTPLTCAGGSISDLWSPMERVFAFPVFANAAFLGPILGPVVGGFVAQSSLVSWRWVSWVTLIITGLILTILLLFQPETYPPVLLKWKAKHLRAITGDERYRAEVEIREETFVHRLRRALYRPFLLTVREPIIMLVTLYLTVIYIIVFTFLDGYKYIFSDVHGTSQGITGLCFLGIAVGLCCASGLVPIIYRWAKRDLAKIQEQGGDRLPPEFRLWYAMLGGAVAIPVSLFWMGWTSYPEISIWSPLAASVVFGYGILCIFITSYQYIIDAYETFAASALVSVTLVRYLASGIMTVVGIPFYKNLGVQYTLTVLACISAALVPVPYVFYKYGHIIRARSKYAIG